MDASMDLTKLKVLDLKKELKNRGLSVTGKRSELIERLQAAVAAGVGCEDGGDDDEEFDEDEILAGDDADDDDSKMTPMEEAAALAAAEKATATPGRGRRAVVAAGAAATPSTPRTAQRKLALRRTTSPTLVVPVEEVAPAAAVKKSPMKTSAPAVGDVKEPPTKVAKLDVADDEATADKENGDATKAKSTLEIRAERFGIVADSTMKQKRAERFGVSPKSIKKLGQDTVEVDVGTLKKRAERFGVTTAKSLTKAEADEKKTARKERFGNGTADASKTDDAADADAKPSDDKTSASGGTNAEVLAARAAKFGGAAAVTAPADAADAAPVEPVFSASGKKLITISAADASKQKRAARFSAA